MSEGSAEARRGRQRRYRASHLEYYRERERVRQRARNAAARKKRKEIWLEIVGGRGCQVCGTTEGLHLHHRVGTVKEFNIGNAEKEIGGFGKLREKMIEEGKKCDVLCNRHHRLEHIRIERAGVEVAV